LVRGLLNGDMIADDAHVYVYRSGSSFALPLPLISKVLVCPDKAVKCKLSELRKKYAYVCHNIS